MTLPWRFRACSSFAGPVCRHVFGAVYATSAGVFCGVQLTATHVIYFFPLFARFALVARIHDSSSPRPAPVFALTSNSFNSRPDAATKSSKRSRRRSLYCPTEAPTSLVAIRIQSRVSSA